MKQHCYLVIAFFLFIFSPYFALANDNDGKASSVPGYTIGQLKNLMNNITRTGVGYEGISAIEKPQFVNVSDASLSMDDDEIIFIIEYPEGITRIYPQRILVWHEVINDILPDTAAVSDETYLPVERSDRRYTITYSPLTGAVVAFKSSAGRYPSTFGTTGDLLNGNTILYDRISHSTWSQMLGVCIDGPLINQRLQRVPVLWGTWKGVKKRYLEKAEVLSRSTGFKRTYGKDPYGSYQTTNNYYDNARISFPVAYTDKRLHPKKRILGIEYEDIYAALQKDVVKLEKVLNFTLGITPMVAIYDEEIDVIRVFDRRIDGKKEAQPLTFKIFEDTLIDEQTNSQWEVAGKGIYGQYRDTHLVPIYAIDSMWFAWAALHKGTGIIP